MIYVRRVDADVWHWRTDCSNWPAGAAWALATVNEIRESLGKEGEAGVVGTGTNGRRLRRDWVAAGQASENATPVKVRRSKPTSGELCDECLAKEKA